MKNRIKLTESQLHKVIKESVRKVLGEMSGNDMALINGPMGDSVEDMRSYYPNGKKGDMDYDWDFNFDYGKGENYKRDFADSDLKWRNSDWTDRELKKGKGNMKAWVNGRMVNSEDEEGLTPETMSSLEGSWKHRPQGPLNIRY